MDFQELTDLGDDRVTIRVAVVDVHPLFRRRVIGILQATEGIEVVGEGIDSTDAVDLVEQVLPDVLIMELSTPKKTYLENIQRLHVLSSSLKILILSVREEEVLRELGTDAINKDIAQRLSIREHTVRFHVRNILNKLHMSNRVEAATYARREGLVKK